MSKQRLVNLCSWFDLCAAWLLKCPRRPEAACLRRDVVKHDTLTKWETKDNFVTEAGMFAFDLWIKA